MHEGAKCGGVPEWLKGMGCKPIGYAYVGSNPIAPTIGLHSSGVEHFLGKEEVTSSNLVAGSRNILSGHAPLALSLTQYFCIHFRFWRRIFFTSVPNDERSVQSTRAKREVQMQKIGKRKWRCSSVGESARFIPVRSLVQIQSPLPGIMHAKRLHSDFCVLKYKFENE